MAKSSVLDAAERKSLSSKGCPQDCPLVLVCRKCDHHEQVIDFLSTRTRAAVRTVRCQKVCEGPVAGIKVDGKMQWFGKMAKAKHLKAFALLAAQRPPSRVPAVLNGHRSRERSGCLPR